MSEKKIPISIDTSRTKDGFDKLKQSAETLARDIVRSSRALSTSYKEVTKDIEDQIRAIEKRNKLDLENSRLLLRQKRDSGQITPEAFKKQMSATSLDSIEDRRQTSILRDILDAIQKTSKDEIRDNRAAVEQRLLQSKTVDQLKPEGDPMDLLKETMQKGMIGQIGQKELEQKNDFQAYRGGIQSLQRLLGASNIYSAGMGLGQDVAGRYSGSAGATGFAALTAASVMGLGMKAIGASQAYARSLAGNVGLFGGNISGYEAGLEGTKFGFQNRFTNLGVDLQGAAQRRVDVGRASGVGSYSRAFQSFELEKGAGLDTGTVMQMETLSRSGKMTAMQQTGGMVSALRSVGAIQGGNLSLLPEYLQTMIGIGQEQLATLGQVNEGVNIRMVAGIASMDDSFKNPAVLQSVASSLYSGLKQAQTPQVEALQFSVLSRMKPGASLFELQKMRENPDEKYLSEYLGALRGTSLTDESYYQNIAQAFGMSATMAEKVGQGDVKLADVIGQDFGTAEGEISGRAGKGRGTAEIEVSTAKFTSQFQQTGKDLIDGMDRLATNMVKIFNNDIGAKIGEVAAKLDTIIERNNEATKNMNDISTEMIKSNRLIERMLAGFLTQSMRP